MAWHVSLDKISFLKRCDIMSIKNSLFKLRERNTAMHYELLPNVNFGVSDKAIKNFITNEIVLDTNEPMTLNLYGIDVTKPLKWFYLLAKNKIYLPIGYRELISKLVITEFGYVYSEKLACCVQTTEPVIIMKDNVEYAISFSFNIPTIGLVAINKNGDIISVETKEIIRKCSTNVLSRDYYRYSIMGYELYVHRLMADAWVYNVDPVNKYQVNHLDLNKTNNHPSNIEWVTPSENQQHRADNERLRQDGVKGVLCKIRHKDTGEIKLFKTIKEMTDFLGMAPKPIGFFLSNKSGYLVNNYEVRLNGDSRSWYYVDNKKPLPLWVKAVYKVLLNNEVTDEFYTLHDLCEHFGLKSRLLIPDLKKYITKINPAYDIVIKDLSRSGPYEAINITTGERLIRDNIMDFSKMLNLSDSVIGTRIREGRDKLPYNGWLFRYASDTAWDLNNLETTNSIQSKKVRVTNLANGEFIIHDSVKTAIAKTPNISSRTLKVRLKTRKPYLGFSYTYE